MIKETITYTDYNGEEHTEDFYFNLSEVELTRMNLSVEGGYGEFIQRIVADKNAMEISNIMEKFILDSYGIKSDDGKRFIKSKELSEEFSQTAAYSQLYMKLMTNDEAAAAFVNGIIPANLAQRLDTKPSNS